MRNLSRLLLPLCSAPLLGSCYFLLDYDDLQDGPIAAAAGAPSAAGAPAGGASTCGDCDDQDPCTADSCDDGGEKPECVHAATEGLALDGFETTLAAEHHVRVSLVGSGQLFYLAALETNQSIPKLSLYRLESDGQELEEIGTDLKLDGSPVSNVGLAVEELPLGEVALHGFVATKLKLSDVARVFHVENKGGKTTSNLAGASYKADNPTVFPQALALGNKVVGAWIQADGTIAVHNVGTLKTDSFGIATLPATTLSLLSTADAQPAVMFTAQAQPQSALGTYVETSGQNRARLPECETRPGDYVSSTVIGTQIPGVWLANITRAGDDYLANGGGTVVCGNNACTPVGEDCKNLTPSSGVRDVAGATVRFDGDPPGIVYSVLALPQIAPKDSDPSIVEGRLSLGLGRVDFSIPGKAESTKIGGDTNGLVQIAQNDTSEAAGFAGPDWPAVSILPTRQVAIAWIQPNEAADGTELHVQRYKMCLPAH
jgi:hypothetical protein